MLKGFGYAPDKKISICIPRVFCFLITKILYSNHYYFTTVHIVCLSTDLGLPTSDSSSSAFVAAASAAWLRPAASLSLLLPLPADWPLLFLLPDLFKCLLPGDLSRRNLKQYFVSLGTMELNLNCTGFQSFINKFYYSLA